MLKNSVGYSHQPPAVANVEGSVISGQSCKPTMNAPKVDQHIASPQLSHSPSLNPSRITATRPSIADPVVTRLTQ